MTSRSLIPPDPPRRSRVPHMTVDELREWYSYSQYRSTSQYLPTTERARWRTVFEAVDAELVRRFGKVRHG